MDASPVGFTKRTSASMFGVPPGLTVLTFRTRSSPGYVSKESRYVQEPLVLVLDRQVQNATGWLRQWISEGLRACDLGNVMATQYERACVTAVTRAFDAHMAFTGGLPLTFAPEAFIQGQIATELSGLNLFVTLETKVYDTLTEAGAEMRGRKMKRAGGRIDLVTWWKNGTPRHIVEVKKLRHKEAIRDDVVRIRSILSRGGSTRQGLIVLYADARQADTVTRRINHAANETGTQLVKRSGVRSFKSHWDDYRESHYEAACLRIVAG